MKNKVSILSSCFQVILFVGSLSLLMNCKADKPTIPPQPTLKNLTLPSIPGLRIRITSPADRSTVPQETTTRGTVSGLPSGHVIRVLVRPPGDRWWVQPTVVLLPDSSWSATTLVGIRGDSGKEFLIGAVAITEQQRMETDRDLSGNTQFRVDGQFPAIVTVTRQ